MKKGNMGNETKHGVITFQGSVISSMPLEQP
jgi:hypothetical protein